MIADCPTDTGSGTSFVVPYEIVWYGGRPAVSFASVTAEELNAPLWHVTIQRRQLVALRSLDEIAFDAANVPLKGMIHHMGRCGSTLISKQLSALANVYTLREPNVLLQILRAEHGSFADRTRWLRSLVAAFAAGLERRAQHLVIKWMCIPEPFTAEIAAMFPGVPTIFIHRDPVEVLMSYFASPSKLPAGWNKGRIPPILQALNSIASLPHLELEALLVASLCNAICEMPHVRSVGYRSLPQITWEKIAPHFGLRIDAEDIRKMQELSLFYAKQNTGTEKRTYSDDSELKQITANEYVRALAQRIIEPSLARLHTVSAPL